MILDNSRIHHAKPLEPFLLEQKNRLKFVFLPPYSPKLNLIEGFWEWLKSDIINNVFYNSAKEIRTPSCKIFIATYIDIMLPNSIRRNKNHNL